MIDRRIANRVVQLLNEMISIDAQAVTDLCNARVTCNDSLAQHDTVQVSSDNQVGILGVLNGICGKYDHGERKGWGAVAVVFDDTGLAIEAKILEND